MWQEEMHKHRKVVSQATGFCIRGNSRRHQLVAGNKLGSHKTVYRQLCKGFGMSAG